MTKVLGGLVSRKRGKEYSTDENLLRLDSVTVSGPFRHVKMSRVEGVDFYSHTLIYSGPWNGRTSTPLRVWTLDLSSSSTRTGRRLRWERGETLSRFQGDRDPYEPEGVLPP